MSIIQAAIYEQKNKTNNEKLAGSSFKNFRNRAAGKKIFLFGGAAGCDYFLKKYGGRFHAEYILDNNKDRKGHSYTEYSRLKRFIKRTDIQVETPDILEQYETEEIVVLITGTNCYEEIADQLEGAGIHEYYSLCTMEARRPLVRLHQTVYKVWRKLKEKGLKLEHTVWNHTGWNRYVLKQRLRFYRYRRYKIRNNKIVFHTFGEYSGHGKYIARALMKTDGDFDIVWIVKDDKVQVPDGIRIILQSEQEKYAYELSTAKVWVNDIPFPLYVSKRREQYYIQTKHWAGVTLKKFYLDAPMLLTEIPKTKIWEYNGRIMDFIITGSKFDTESCRRGFHFRGDTWEVGSPRSDILYSSIDYHQYICDRLHIPGDTRLLLYAPTYRFASETDRSRHEVRECNLDYALLGKTLEKRFGGNWTILLRLHPSVAKALPPGILWENVWNVSDYEDSQELVAACEIMISDYSSIMFEPCFAEKPVFLFVSDLEQYRRMEYDFLIEIDELPFPLAETNERLMRNIEEFDGDNYHRELDSFLKKYGVHEDGHASRRAAERIIGLMKSET